MSNNQVTNAMETINEQEVVLLENTGHTKYTYQFVSDATASWRSAQEHCRQLGGQLYIINTRDHWMTLMDNIADTRLALDGVFKTFLVYMSKTPLDHKVRM